jgi:hypothetical protein
VAASQSSSSSSSMVWRLVPPSIDSRPTVVFGLAQRRRTSPTFEDEDEDEDESLQLCLIRIP